MSDKQGIFAPYLQERWRVIPHFGSTQKFSVISDGSVHRETCIIADTTKAIANHITSLQNDYIELKG